MQLKNSKYCFLISLAALFMLPGCGIGSDSEDSKRSQTESTAATKNIKVINVLDPELYSDAHIDGSINIEFGKVVDTAKSENWNKDTKIVLYCSNYMCSASGEEARKLKDLGYTDVAVYEGGMAQWYTLSQNDPSYKVVGQAKQEYLNLPNEKPAKVGEADILEITAQELKDILSK